MVSKKFFFTEQFIRLATKEKYGVNDLYEEILPVPPDTEPSSPAFSDKSE